MSQMKKKSYQPICDVDNMATTKSARKRGRETSIQNMTSVHPEENTEANRKKLPV